MDTWNPRKQQNYLTASDQSLRTVQNPQLSSAREEPDMASSSNNSPSFKVYVASLINLRSLSVFAKMFSSIIGRASSPLSDLLHGISSRSYSGRRPLRAARSCRIWDTSSPPWSITEHPTLANQVSRFISSSCNSSSFQSLPIC